jgi:hypothetical protein
LEELGTLGESKDEGIVDDTFQIRGVSSVGMSVDDSGITTRDDIHKKTQPEELIAFGEFNDRSDRDDNLQLCDMGTVGVIGDGDSGAILKDDKLKKVQPRSRKSTLKFDPLESIASSKNPQWTDEEDEDENVEEETKMVEASVATSKAPHNDALQESLQALRFELDVEKAKRAAAEVHLS